MSDQYYPFYVGDYLRDTAALTLVEHGAYHLLLHEYYTNNGTLTSDRVKLYRICRAFTKEEQTAINTICDRFFTENGNGLLKNRKADEVLNKRNTFINQQREKGKKSAEKRWGSVTKAITMVKPMLQPDCNLPSPSPSLLDNKMGNSKHTKGGMGGDKTILPEWLPETDWNTFLAHRKIIKVPITKESYPKFIAKFEKLKDRGYPPQYVIDKMVEKGWRWFSPEWLKQEEKPDGIKETSPRPRNLFLDPDPEEDNPGGTPVP